MRWMLLGVLTGVIGCAARVPETPGTPPMAGDGLLDWTQVVVRASDTGEVARTRMEARTRASATGHRVRVIEVTPNRIELAVGDEKRVRSLVRVVGRDSTGRVVTGWSPYFVLSGAGPARFQQSMLTAVAPGTVELRVHPMVADSVPPARPIAPTYASIQVVVKAPVYSPPTAPPVTPAEVVTSYLAALGAEQWKDAASFVDLERFGAFFRQRISAGRVQLPEPLLTFEEFERVYGGRSGSPPRAVLEWQYQQYTVMRKYDLPFGDFSREFAGVTSFRMLAELSVEDAVARWLEASDPRHQARLTARLVGCDSLSTERMLAARPRRNRLVGIATASDTTAWALVATMPASAFPGQEVPPDLLLLRRRPGSTWRVDPHSRGMAGYSIATEATNCVRREPR